MCPANSITNNDGTCTCMPGFAPDGNGSCVSFDYNAAHGAANEQAKWKEYLNDYGPVLLGGFAAWWASRNQPKTTPAATPPAPQDQPKQGVPIWVWIGGGLVVVVVLVALLRRSSPAQ
jgi:hypothetical protein